MYRFDKERFIAYFIVAICLVFFWAAIFTAISRADTWEVLKGFRILKGPNGETIRAWSPGQWQEDGAQLEGIGYSEGFQDPAELDAYSEWARDNPDLVSEAWTVNDALRGEGTALPSADTYAFDGLAADTGAVTDTAGGILGVGVGSALGTVVLGGGAFVLGVELGNGLDQLFGLPEWKIFTSETEEKEAATEAVAHENRLDKITYEREVESEPIEGDNVKRKLKPGWYYSNDVYGEGGPFLLELAVTCVPDTGCTSSDVESENYAYSAQCGVETYRTCYPWQPAKFHRLEIVTKDFTTSTRHKIESKIWLYYPLEKCDTEYFSLFGLPGENCIQPLGVPTTAPLTKPQEKENEKHGEPAKPKVTPEIPLAPTKITEEQQRQFDETPAREKKEKLIPEHGELEIPAPGNELATVYVSELETIGFNDVSSYTVPETAINPDVGPNEVAAVNPAPGSKVNPDARVTVAVNPADAPIPESRTPIGGPTLPGIKLPNLPLLCNTMPFGVPCWLVKQIEAFSGTGAAPIWKIGPFYIQGNKIGPAEVHLSDIESIMEVVRPFMVLFGTIGIVLLFYRIFTGKSLGGGENPAGQVPDPEPPGPGNSFDDEYDTRGYGGGIL
jgi:hypothetical protein